MSDQILALIGTHINDKNPGTFSTFQTGVRRIEDGRLIIRSQTGDHEFAGLTDKKANYFYIRYVGDIEVSPVTERLVSCSEIEAKFTARAVFWVNKGNLVVMSEVLLDDLLTFRSDVYRMNLTPTKVLLDYDTLYKEETEKDEVKKYKKLALLGVDFEISVNYRPQAEECLERNFCIPC